MTAILRRAELAFRFDFRLDLFINTKNDIESQSLFGRQLNDIESQLQTLFKKMLQ